MSITLSALMKQRYDTAANWTAQNPTLLAGEFGIESDTKKWKVGDGSTAWTSLLYSNGGTYPLVNADIAANAEIAVSKLADGSARQLLQTDAAGTGVEWTSDVSIPGVLSVTAGTAALPGIAVSGDPNTGIYSPGADQLAISTNGTQRLLADSAGGVTVPTRFIIGQVNNVGGLSEATRTTSGIFNTSRLLDGGTNPYLQTGAEAGIVYFNADGSSAPATVFRVGGTERLRLTSTGALNFVGAGVAGSTQAVSFNGSAPVNSLVIDSSGLVGIGASSPGYLLDIQSTSATLRIKNTTAPATGGTSSLLFEGINNFSGTSQSFINSIQAGNSGVTQLAFGTSQSANATATERLRIGSAGTLEIKAAASTAPFIANIGVSEAARIDSSGRLLVGTSSSRQVTIGESSGWDPRVQVTKTGTDGGNIAAYSWSTYNTSTGGGQGIGPDIVLARSNNDTEGTHTALTNAQLLGRITFNGSNGTSFASGAYIAATADDAWASGDCPTRLVFSTTADGAASPTEALRITNDRVLAYNQPTPATYAAAATLTVADLKTGIITYTGANATLTLPTGTLTEGGFDGIYTNMAFEWSVINTGGAGNCTIGAGTAHTIVGSAVVTIGTSGRFASRRTAANTFVSYRLS